ncbi:MAG: serine/threonine-protein kinase [Polyangia bacterium]
MSDAASVEQGAPAPGGSEPGPGTVLAGKYRLSRRLGDGAMGVVFLGVHERLGREVAVKILRPELSSLSDAVARFQREAELVTRIGHPSIVTVYDYGRAPDGSVYYVMELLSGRPLRTRLQEGPLSDDEVVDVFAPLLSAVHSAHAVSAVHRDLKPDKDAAAAGAEPATAGWRLHECCG